MTAKETIKETILVAGATGQQGGAVADSLLKRGMKVRALTRNASKAEHLKTRGAEVVTGELSDRSSLDRALEGVKKVYLVTTPFEAGFEAEVTQGTNMVDAALNAGVDHLVFSSVNGAERKSGIPHFETKWKVEEYIREKGIPHTIIRPVFFMDNFYAPWLLPSLKEGTLAQPMGGHTLLQMISVHDIGEFAANAFARKNEFISKEVDIAGDELTLDEAVRMISGLVGKTISYVRLPDDKAEEIFGHDMVLMYKWFEKVGYNVNIVSLESEWGIPVKRFREFLEADKTVEKFRAAFPGLHVLKTA
jgi:uncharacterized protein YbjT (DUF2867 family)